jgi:hypothetical protein
MPLPVAIRGRGEASFFYECFSGYRPLAPKKRGQTYPLRGRPGQRVQRKFYMETRI